MIQWQVPNWRDDRQLTSVNIYKKRWAFFPVLCTGNESVWFKRYYSKYRIWGDADDKTAHRDFLENITEAEYIIRKLSEDV